jgi:hypothetical protein
MDDPPMSDLGGGRAWFRPRTYGVGATPVSWQGWLVTLAFAVLVFATVSAGAPWREGPAAVWAYLQTHHHIGFDELWSQHRAAGVAVILEVAGFIALTRWKSSGPWLRRGGGQA